MTDEEVQVERKRKKKKSRQVELEDDHGHRSSKGQVNGHHHHRVREVDVSEIPEHLLKMMTRVEPKGPGEAEGLRSEDWESVSCSGEGDDGVWILQCPKDVSLSRVICGEKLSLDGRRSLIGGGADGEEDEEDLELTQYVPSSTLGQNVRKRQFEAVPVPSEGKKKEGVVLLLPENDHFKIVSAPVQGHIIVREAVSELAVPEIQVVPPKPHELPPGIKERHPVYGVNFTEILKEMGEGSPKKKKKNKRKSESEPDPEPELEPPKFTKLSMSFNGGTNSDDPMTSYDFDESAVKKKKKKKKRKHDNDDDESQTQDETYEDLPPPKEEVETEVETPSKKKKSKKRKREEEDEKDNDEVPPPSKKSKKSKHRHD